jgi:alpha-L-glutamate ligase-like protein
MNARNLVFIRPYNPGRAIKIANNKLATKKKLLKAGLPTAKLYGVIRDRKELFAFDWSKLPSSCVVKPNLGLGGGGIIVCYGQDKQGRWISTGDTTYTKEELRRHVSNILDGNFSMSNVPDIAYFEERLRLTEDFKNIAYQGVPDIRVLVFNSVPVMAMLRLPTKESQGKANMQIGGIGVGVDLATGVTTFAASKKVGPVTVHPDFKTPLQGIQIPDWDNILRLGIEASKAIGLGYAGVDIVLDKQYGPVVLEVNGHPGIEIQNANHLTLRDRLERVAGLSINSTAKGLSVCKQLFGHHDLADHSDAVVLGVYEPVVVYQRTGQASQLRALVDTSLMSTTITKELALRLGYGEALAAIASIDLSTPIAADRAQAVEAQYRSQITKLHSDWIDVAAVRSYGQYIIRPKLSLKIEVGGKTITSTTAVALDNRLSSPMVLGRRDLTGFLINPNRGMM